MSHFQHRKSYPTNGNFGVYGIDCEMCYTIAGLELTKVLIVKSLTNCYKFFVHNVYR